MNVKCLSNDSNVEFKCDNGIFISTHKSKKLMWPDLISEKSDDCKWQKATRQVTRTLQWLNKAIICMEILREKMDRRPCVNIVKVNMLIMEEPVIRETTWYVFTVKSCTCQPEDQTCLNGYLSKTKCTEDYTKKKTEHITDMVARDLLYIQLPLWKGWALIN